MENLINKESGNIDKTITKTDKKICKSGIECKWKLNALSEYLKDDIELSDKVMDDVAFLLKERELKDVTIELTEGYDNENQGKEHYRLKMIFGNGSNNEKLIFSKHYSAITEHGEIKGSVQVKVGLLNDSIENHKDLDKNIADIYIKRMEKTYTDWKNQWQEEGEFTELTS